MNTKAGKRIWLISLSLSMGPISRLIEVFRLTGRDQKVIMSLLHLQICHSWIFPRQCVGAMAGFLRLCFFAGRLRSKPRYIRVSLRLRKRCRPVLALYENSCIIACSRYRLSALYEALEEEKLWGSSLPRFPYCIWQESDNITQSCHRLRLRLSRE